MIKATWMGRGGKPRQREEKGHLLVTLLGLRIQTTHKCVSDFLGKGHTMSFLSLKLGTCHSQSKSNVFNIIHGSALSCLLCQVSSESLKFWGISSSRCLQRPTQMVPPPKELPRTPTAHKLLGLLGNLRRKTRKGRWEVR